MFETGLEPLLEKVAEEQKVAVDPVLLGALATAGKAVAGKAVGSAALYHALKLVNRARSPLAQKAMESVTRSAAGAGARAAIEGKPQVGELGLKYMRTTDPRLTKAYETGYNVAAQSPTDPAAISRGLAEAFSAPRPDLPRAAGAPGFGESIPLTPRGGIAGVFDRAGDVLSTPVVDIAKGVAKAPVRAGGGIANAARALFSRFRKAPGAPPDQGSPPPTPGT